MTKVTIDLDVITSEMDTLKDERARLKFELNNIEKEIEKRELQLIALLSKADVKSMDYGVYSFGLVEKSRTAFDQALFKEENPKLFEKYYLTKVNERFEFKINK
jgi:hypothetical protein